MKLVLDVLIYVASIVRLPVPSFITTSWSMAHLEEDN